MSYADVAAKGPKQSAEEAAAPPMPQIERTDESVHSLIDVDSPHVSSVPSDFSSQTIKTETQAERIELEEQARAAAASSSQSGKKTDRAAFAKQNVGNPVVLGNMLGVGVLGGVLSVGAYKKWTRGELGWKVLGIWAGVVGVFGVADYYVSRYFFQKYPPKK
ncbi:hypothetical protein CC78DRAFT_548915 [Lojkania enalia]|uniref:Mitochondrial outer membrane protein OM14 C-terminal domain-containing protein n=1 Tax=Lojkania enalia TaxID=147567 RepID=A0A9P4JWY5_9PLEO|nr:hypothetical protein CC78DRAFT_548915 [Didymosphaeria enalia]